jgi:hypothetical protein
MRWSEPAFIIGVGVIMGSIARLAMLKVDYRQYPSYPQAYTVHLAFGVISAFLGAVAVPAVLARDYTAATFLALAATQFREIRKIERETLQNVEETELVSRGSAYIEGIARSFEARNYLAMVTALLVTLTITVLNTFIPRQKWIIYTSGIAAGILTILLLRKSISHKKLGSMVMIKPAEIHFEGPVLMVGQVSMINVGDPLIQEKYRRYGMAVTIHPQDPNAKATIANLGQRQAIAHNASALLGIRKDVDTPLLTPIVRRNIDIGDLALIIVPAEPDREALLQAVADTPVLEGAVRKPMAAKSARMVD